MNDFYTSLSLFFTPDTLVTFFFYAGPLTRIPTHPTHPYPHSPVFPYFVFPSRIHTFTREKSHDACTTRGPPPTASGCRASLRS